MSNNEPDTLIESQGYVYKLLTSKEEQKKIDAQKAEDQTKNFNTFKQKIGSEQYDYLHTKGVTLSYYTGGHYSVEVFYDFKNNLTWRKDEYSTSNPEHFGDTDWYTYDHSEFSRNFVTQAIHKMLQDYYFSELTK